MDPSEQPSTPPVVQPASETRKSTFGDSAVWMRGLYMLLFALAFGVGQTLLCVAAIAQFLWLLFAGEANAQIAQFALVPLEHPRERFIAGAVAVADHGRPDLLGGEVAAGGQQRDDEIE